MGCGSSKSVETGPASPPLAQAQIPVAENKSIVEEVEESAVVTEATEEIFQKQESEEEVEEAEEEEIELVEQHGTYTPPTEFPTPALLYKAQDVYREANVALNLDQQGTPLPFPPPARKHDVFNLQNSKNADDLTLKVPLSAAEFTYRDLAEHLTRHCTSDVEKVRSFFVWISSQSVRGVVRHVETVGLDRIATTSPLFLLTAILVTRRAGSYSYLLASLCKEANIPVRVVQSSLVRGVHMEPGSSEEDLKADNTHCIVYVSGAWRIIDQHWGSEGVIASAGPDWELIAGRETLPNTEEEGQLVHRRSEYYFLIDPERYIFQQWCANQSEQLLARPVSKDEFIRMAFVKARFFEMGFTSIDPPECMQTTSNGRIVIKLGLPASNAAYFDYTLLKSKFDDDQNEIDGQKLDRYVLGETTKEFAVFHVNLRRYGTHRLQLWAGPDKWHLDVVCEMRIMCETPDFRQKILPFNEKIMFGLNPLASRYNLEADSTVGGIIQAENGVAFLRLICKSIKSVQITYELSNPDIESWKLQNNIRHYFTESYLIIVAVLPRHGDYFLKMRANDGVNGNSEIGNYLIKSSKRFCYPTPFPKSSGKESQIGDLTRPGGEYLESRSHTDAIITYDNEEELKISMSILNPEVKYSAQLFHCSKDLRETNLTEFVFTELDDDQLILLLRFCRVGTYKLNILVDQSIIYQYIIRAMTLTEIIQPFPQRLPRWNNSYRILEPSVRTISWNQLVRFRVQIFEVQQVFVEFRGRKFELTQNEDGDAWQADVQIGYETGDLRISALTLDEALKSQPILQYQVEDDGKMKQLETQRSTLAEQAKRWREALEREEARERDVEKERQKEEDEEVREKEQDFHRNKERYKSEEKVFVRREREKKEEVEKEEFSPEIVEEDIKPEDLMKAKEYETKEAEKRRKLWQREYDKMKPELAIVRLREAASSRNLELLRNAIDDCRSRRRTEEYEEEICNAEILLRRLKLRIALEEAMESRDLTKIEEMIAEIKEKRYARRLDQEIRHAENRIKVVRMMSGVNKNFLNMDRVTMMELRSYKVPPRPVQAVMMAFYLLLGEDEGKTMDWKYCIKLCQTQGSASKNLMYKVANLRASDLHPEIAARAIEILSGVRLQDVRRVSGGAATFYIWTKGVLDDYRKSRSFQDDDQTNSLGNGYQGKNPHDDSYRDSSRRGNRYSGIGYRGNSPRGNDNQDNGYSGDESDEGYDEDAVTPASIARQREIFLTEERNRRHLANQRVKFGQ